MNTISRTPWDHPSADDHIPGKMKVALAVGKWLRDKESP